ncbi:hypothetical protein INR77_08965 [Erythrobacter sp. SCSIO 43205]|uniref:hypothetical protein n=1 Tax=Erythrobacter sp. SCSIO 43205 TaxID=2779361 RepID=UPI001CA84151|nr:hypothetical protein [Erythrobacter sp. SCSIO 43205]UAB76977.1 hypothetical protein INR77_08965 [Erythrobacter sp. SCSIO 43205]
MNALTAIEPQALELESGADKVPDLDAWRTRGRDLARTRLTIDFELGDWLAYGREHFAPEQIELALGDIAADVEQARHLRKVEKVARAFPPSQRNTALTFEHHAHLADLPTQEALPLLQKAGQERLTARQLRVEAMLRKVDLGLVLPREDDPEDDALLSLCRAWNRAPVSVREDFSEMIADCHMGVVEP